MKEKYEINSRTIAIIPVAENISQIIEVEDNFLIHQSTTGIIEDSCKFFGSSYSGRHEGTKNLIGVNYKSPIIVEESLELIFFPTASPRIQDCAWLSLNHIENYFKKGYVTQINFKNGKKIELEISCGSLENQIMIATMLEVMHRKRTLA